MKRNLQFVVLASALEFVLACSAFGVWSNPAGGWDGSWVADVATQNFPMPTRASDGADPTYHWRNLYNPPNAYFHNSNAFIWDHEGGDPTKPILDPDNGGSSMHLASSLSAYPMIGLYASDDPNWDPDALSNTLVYWQYRLGKIANQDPSATAAIQNYLYVQMIGGGWREIGLFWDVNNGIRATYNGGSNYTGWYDRGGTLDLSSQFVDVRVVYNRVTDRVEVFFDGNETYTWGGPLYWHTGINTAQIKLGDGHSTFDGDVHLSNMYWSAVPEPMTVGLISLGIIGLLSRR